MVKKRYHIQVKNEKKLAKAMLKNQPISTKYATEMAREIKGKNLRWAEKFAMDIAEMKRHLPLRKYRKKMGHRRGAAVSSTKSGRYPIKVAKKFSEMFSLVKANADYRGLDSENLIITGVFVSDGFGRTSHQPQGRISGKIRTKKSTHMEIVVVEGK